jgi:putative DNA primase/helicase
MVNLARGIEGIPIDHEDLDRDGWLLGVENGLMDLRTGQLRPADPRDLMCKQAPVAWNPEAKAPRWERALGEWFPNPELRVYVHRVAGSALVGAQRDHIFVIHYGDGRNGKGTFVRALQSTLGPYARVVHLSLLVEQRHSQHDTVKANLFRARLAVASETRRRIRLDEASVKNLTGGDRITARRMREDSWEFDPTHSLWLQTNHLPEISGRDRGIWSRIRVVKWVASFRGTEEPDLDDTLAAEGPGILRWLVEGCRAYLQHGLAEPEAVVRETLAYRQTEDKLERFADDVGLRFAPSLEIPAGLLQKLLAEWSDEQGITIPQGVGDWLIQHGAEKTRRWQTDPGTTQRKQVRFWTGAGLPASDSEPENDTGDSGDQGPGLFPRARAEADKAESRSPVSPPPSDEERYAQEERLGMQEHGG